MDDMKKDKDGYDYIDSLKPDKKQLTEQEEKEEQIYKSQMIGREYGKTHDSELEYIQKKQKYQMDL